MTFALFFLSFHIRPPPPLRKIFFFFFDVKMIRLSWSIHRNSFHTGRAFTSVISWICHFLFSLFAKHSSSSSWYVFEFVFKTAFFFLTASAAKEAMLPYFPQIVEYLKVTQDNFFTVYSEVNLEYSVFTWRHVPPKTVFQTSRVGFSLVNIFFCLNKFALLLVKNLYDSHYAQLSLINQFYRQYSTVEGLSCGLLVAFSC